MRRTTITKPGFIFLKKDVTYPKWKVTINDEDVTEYMPFSEVVRTATERIDYVHLTLDNYEGRFNNKWNPESNNITIKAYFDYGTASNWTTHTPTNQVFTGKMDSAKPGLGSNGWVMEIYGRNNPELYDVTQTISFDNINVAVAIKSVIDALNDVLGYDVITYTGSSISTSTTSISETFRDERSINILATLCKKTGFDSRIDMDGVYFAKPKGSEICTNEYINASQNMFACPPAGRDAINIKNYIRVYGPEKEGCLIVHTKKTNSPVPWRKDLIVNDTALQNRAEVVNRAEREYEDNVDSEILATPICVGLPTLLPGQSIRTLIPYVVDGYYIASQVSHVFSMGGCETKISLNEIERGGLSLIKNNNKLTRELSTFDNLNNMEFSYHFTFEDDTNIESQSDTTLSNGKLVLATDKTSGVMTSDSLTLDFTASYVELRFNGNDDCDLCTFEVSCDNGDNYEFVTPGYKGTSGTQLNIANSGTQLKFRVNMISNVSNPIPEIESLVLLAKG